MSKKLVAEHSVLALCLHIWLYFIDFSTQHMIVLWALANWLTWWFLFLWFWWCLFWADARCLCCHRSFPTHEFSRCRRKGFRVCVWRFGWCRLIECRLNWWQVVRWRHWHSLCRLGRWGFDANRFFCNMFYTQCNLISPGRIHHSCHTSIQAAWATVTILIHQVPITAG